VNMSPSLLTYTALGSNSLQLTLRDYVKWKEREII
jgi:hypothetical protein